MNNKLKLLALGLLAGGTMLAETRVAIGVNIGGYGPAPAPVYDAYPPPAAYPAPAAYPPPAYGQYQPPCPGPGYVWVDGYWAPQAHGRTWVAGFWRAPARPVAPAFRDHDRDRDHYEAHARDGHFDRDGRNNFRR